MIVKNCLLIIICGDPVYGDDENWVIRGIHSGGYNSGTSKGVAKTIDSKVMNLIRTYEQ